MASLKINRTWPAYGDQYVLLRAPTAFYTDLLMLVVLLFGRILGPLLLVSLQIEDLRACHRYGIRSANEDLWPNQSRFESGLKKGAKVQQGQRIGNVGATGWATGPHLHYEFRIDGKPVDPLSVDLPAAKALESDQIKELQALAGQYKKQLALLKERTDHRMLAMSD